MSLILITANAHPHETRKDTRSAKLGAAKKTAISAQVALFPNHYWWMRSWGN
jgi:hypothetical protein